ncbi:MAG: hypothetical protein K2I76_02445 [Malacoplasma sp.]|nr:hypothetical protein [Malacoplasma sp.]MDE5841721.1 hypothetical protein [Malacoplasma sp.]
MENFFKNLFGFRKKEETKKEKISVENTENNLIVNKKQQLDLIKNKNNNYDNLNMLKDLSLSEKQYLERELDFKYDTRKYNLIDVLRNDSKFFEVHCEIFVNGIRKLVTEKIFYDDIKDKDDIL